MTDQNDDFNLADIRSIQEYVTGGIAAWEYAIELENGIKII